MAGIEITKISLVTYAGEEVSTLNAADPITKYDLRIYYTSTVSGYGVVTVKIGNIVENLGVGTIQPQSRYWEFPMTYFTRTSAATIADLMSIAGLSNQLIISAYASVDSNTSNTASVTISVTGAPPSGPAIQVTKVALVTSGGAEVSTVNLTDYIASYKLRVCYTLSIYSGIIVVVNVGSITGYIGPYDVQLGSGCVEIPLTYIAQSGTTIADLLSIAGITNQLVFNVYVNAGGYSSNTVSATVQVVTPPPPAPLPAPSVSITKVVVFDSSTGKEVTSVNTTDNLIKYALIVYYSSTGTGKCTLTVTVGGKSAWSDNVDIKSGSNYWGVTFAWLAKGTTIADLISQYRITGNQITICADISNVTA
jgi:sulfur carrier protein ThiS